MLRLHDIVMRSMISVLDPKGSLAYERPQSLEEAPAREASPFGRRDRGDYGHQICLVPCLTKMKMTATTKLRSNHDQEN